jgi:hypothetical protein
MSTVIDADLAKYFDTFGTTYFYARSLGESKTQESTTSSGWSSRPAERTGWRKAVHRMGQNHLAHVAGGAINAVLAAASYNFRRLLVWLMLLRACFLHAVLGARSSNCRLIAS